jgi:hypothetical protein
MEPNGVVRIINFNPTPEWYSTELQGKVGKILAIKISAQGIERILLGSEPRPLGMQVAGLWQL